ncbi:MAG: hypothetical protein ABI880_15935 [Acidobacteriota bacterium]
MRHLPGWVVGALGTAAIVASFYAGGAMRASTPASSFAQTSFAAAPASDDATAFEVACEPGQRAVVRQGTTTTAESVACVSEVAAAPVAPSAATVTRAAFTTARPYQPAVPVGETVEVYRPRAVPVSYEPTPAARRAPAREVEPATRSVQKSAVIIASSTAVGATIGGVAKGKKGALIGGIVGGGAAAVWDQVTRRRDDGR